MAREEGRIYVSQDVDEVLVNSEKIAKNMQDEYVSVEHIMLAIFDKPKKISKNYLGYMA